MARQQNGPEFYVDQCSKNVTQHYTSSKKRSNVLYKLEDKEKQKKKKVTA